MFTRYLSIAAATLTLLGLASMSSLADEKGMQHMSIDHQAAMAHTQADHEALAKRFDEEAAKLDKQAGEHERLAKQYRSGVGAGPKSDGGSLATHCDNLVKNLKASADDAREMARMHRDIAKTLTK